MINGFEIYTPTKLHFGAGKISIIGTIAGKYGKKAIIVTGKSSTKKTGSLDKVIKSLENSGIQYVVFDKIEPNPRSTTIDEGSKLAVNERCDMVIGIGGGSAMDASKAIAVLATNEGNCWDYVSGNRSATVALPIICITTTSGTGSEANKFAVVTNPETNEKPGFGFDCMIPAESIIDPELTLSVPARITASVGIDVFFHAIEAYTSNYSNPISDMYAEKAIELVYQNLHTAYSNGSDITARANMAIANTLAGIAIHHAGCTLIHAMAHPISGHYDCAHGEALSSVSIAIIRNNIPKSPEKFAKIAAIMDTNIMPNDPNAEEKIINTLRKFYEPLGLNIDITQLGATEKDLEKLTDDTLSTMGFCVAANPGDTDRQTILRLFQESMKTTALR